MDEVAEPSAVQYDNSLNILALTYKFSKHTKSAVHNFTIIPFESILQINGDKLIRTLKEADVILVEIPSYKDGDKHVEMALAVVATVRQHSQSVIICLSNQPLHEETVAKIAKAKAFSLTNEKSRIKAQGRGGINNILSRIQFHRAVRYATKITADESQIPNAKLDLKEQIFHYKDRKITAPSFLKIIEMLASGAICGKEAIHKGLYGSSSVDYRIIDVFISQLRKALGGQDDNLSPIKTVPGIGYEWGAPPICVREKDGTIRKIEVTSGPVT